MGGISIFELLKERAALSALKHIESGMIVGLGSGTTARYFIEALGKSGKEVIGVPTSSQARMAALAAGITIVDFDQVEEIHVAVDGVDSIGKSAIVKGLGGALTREKIVEYAAKKLIIIADERKLREPTLVPVEVLPFSYRSVMREIEMAGLGVPHLRNTNGFPFITDNGNYIIDVEVTVGGKGRKLEEAFKAIPGVVESGLFTRPVHLIIAKMENGEIVIEEKPYTPVQSN